MKAFVAMTLLILFMYSLAWSASEPSLTIQQGTQKKVFLRSALLKLPTLETIKVEHDPASGKKPSHYQAVPLRDLLKEFTIGADSLVQYRCVDGYTGPLSRNPLLAGPAVPYLAIEPGDKKWAPLKEGDPKTAGPFYIIWKASGPEEVASDEWPYQLVGLDILPPLKVQYPHIFPSSKVSHTNNVYKGFEVFQKNCFSCHSLNLEGGSHIGPDLNRPLSPVEYWNLTALRKYIRDPQSVRHWVNDRMHGFDASTLSDTELNNLFAYFKHMSRFR